MTVAVVMAVAVVVLLAALEAEKPPPETAAESLRCALTGAAHQSACRLTVLVSSGPHWQVSREPSTVTASARWHG